MPLLAIGLGVLLGAGFYFNRHDFIPWLLLGVAVGLLWWRDQKLTKRLEQVESQLRRLQDSASSLRPEHPASSQPIRPTPRATPRTAQTDDDVEFIFEPQPSREIAPQTPASRPGAPISPSAPVAPKEPLVDLWRIIVHYFTGGNVIVRVGVIVLFFGVAFLLKYSAEHNLVPIELRLLGVTAGAIALLLFGWRLRLSRTGYALILQGGAVGILYLTIFAALRLYQLLPVGLTLVLLLLLSAASAALAILQDARMLAVVGIVGGFLAPVLTSTGGGSHVMLFSYYALLNAGIVVIAWHRSWRELNLIGFLFTFGIGTAWGVSSYRPELFPSTEAFLLLFFVFYLVIGLLFARNQPEQWQGYVDGSLVFGTPIVCFALQAGLVRPYEYGLAWSALGLGLVYTLFCALLLRRTGRALRTLASAYLAIGVVFATVAIPLALDGRWTAAAWALEGAALVWLAIRQQRWLARIAGLVLQLLAGAAFLSAVEEPTSLVPIVNGFCLGAALIAVAGLFCGWYLHHHRDRIRTGVAESLIAFAWGLMWWFGNGLHEIDLHVHGRTALAVALCFAAISALVAFAAGRRLDWPCLRRVYFSLAPTQLCGIVYAVDHAFRHPSRFGGLWAWPLFFFVFYLLLQRDEHQSPPFPGWITALLHLLPFWGGTLLLTWEISWWTDHWVNGAGVWPFVIIGMVPALILLALCKMIFRIWPLRDRQSLYLQGGAGPVAVLLWLGTLGTSLVSKGDPWPLPFLPLLNPLDLAQAFALTVLGIWLLTVRRQLLESALRLPRPLLLGIGIGSIFWWLNFVLVRALHHLGHVPFRLHAFVDSDLAQTAFSIFWTVTALLVMWYGTRRGLRPVWLAGSTLIAVVIVKLFTFDLAHTSTVERIVSFIGVGLLCLLIGYLAPLPPRPDTDTETP